MTPRVNVDGWTDGPTDRWINGRTLAPLSHPAKAGATKVKSTCPENIFSIICLWDLFVVVETKVLTRSAPKPSTANPDPSDGTCKSWSRLANWPWRYSCL